MSSSPTPLRDDSWTEFFPDQPYAFSNKVALGSLADFFRPTFQARSLLAARRRIVVDAPAHHILTLPESAAPLREFADLLIEKNIVLRESIPAALQRAPSLCAALALQTEPDFMVIGPGADGRSRLIAAAICFPSSWAPEEKIGLPVAEVHGVVPGLNPAIGEKIERFLQTIKPGTGWLRANWGLSSGCDLNAHPRLKRRPLSADSDPAQTWIRIERQCFQRLPVTGAVIFGIRLELVSFGELRDQPALRGRIALALETLPEEMATYKGLSTFREKAVRWLRTSHSGLS